MPTSDRIQNDRFQILKSLNPTDIKIHFFGSCLEKLCITKHSCHVLVFNRHIIIYATYHGGRNIYAVIGYSPPKYAIRQRNYRTSSGVHTWGKGIYCIFVHTIVFPLYEPWIQTENLFTISDTVVDTNFLDVHVRSAPEPIDEKKEISQNLLKTPIRSDYFTLEIIEKDRSFNYLK